MARRILITIAALAVTASGCGQSPEPAASTPTTLATTTSAAVATTVPEVSEFPVTIDAPNGPVTIESAPARIVSLSPTSTEVLFAVGAGPQVVAVDDQSNFPEDAPTSDLTGFDPNLEAIAGYDADLVVLMYDPGETVAGLEAIGIPVILHPAAGTLDDAYRQIQQIGAATGHRSAADRLVAAMHADIERIVAENDRSGATYYHELSPDHYSVTSQTFVGALYAMLDLVNIADDADPDGYGYPQLSAEHVLAEDPDLIFLADTKCCAQDADAVSERPGWGVLSAVANGSVTELDDDVASRWGPRVVEFVQAIADAVESWEKDDD